MTWFHQLLPIINPSTSFNYTLFFFIHIYIYIYFFFVFSSVNKLGIFIFSFHLCFFIFTVPKQLARLLERTQLVQHVASEKENSKCTRPSIWATCETHSLGDVTLPSLFIANHPPHFTVYSRFSISSVTIATPWNRAQGVSGQIERRHNTVRARDASLYNEKK